MNAKLRLGTIALAIAAAASAAPLDTAFAYQGRLRCLDRALFRRGRCGERAN